MELRIVGCKGGDWGCKGGEREVRIDIDGGTLIFESDMRLQELLLSRTA